MSNQQKSLQNPAGKLNRRRLLQAAAVTTPALVLGAEMGHQERTARLTGSLAAQQQLRLPLNFEFLFDLTVDVQPPLMIENTPRGTRQIVLVNSGRIEGPEISGEILPNGGDWLLMRPDGVAELDVRATVRLDDNQLMYIAYPGLVVASQEIWGQLLGGNEVDPSTYYFRALPHFETGSEKYGWLNNVLAVGVGSAGPGIAWVKYSVYQIL